MSVREKDQRRLGYPTIDQILLRQLPATFEGRKALGSTLAACIAIVADGLTSLKDAECDGLLESIWCYEGAHKDIVQSRLASVCQLVHEDDGGARHPVGTGAMVDTKNGILTAGHVVPAAVALRQPNAGRLLAVFGFEEECRGAMRTANEFPVVQIREWFRGGLDYVILRTGRNKANQHASDRFSPIPLGSPATLSANDYLCCIQHPLGKPKQVSLGKYIGPRNPLLEYDNLTNWQSSGSPILALATGELMAVHNKPSDVADCVNWGCAIDEIQAISKEL